MNEISFQDTPSRDEDFLVEATLIANNSEICTVPCRIYLPERVHEKPYVVLKPKQEAAKQIIGAWKASLKATVYGFDNEAEVTIDAPEVYLSGGSTRYWGNGISDATKLGEPQDLHVVRHLRNRSSVSKTQLVFWISQNRLLEPCMASTSSYTGKIEYERVNVFECYSGGRLKLAFDRHFRTKTESNGDLRQWSFLVAITEVEVAANSADLIKSQILPDIDDLLLIASFAARTRTACLGWTACDDKSLATFYRGNYAFPELNEATDRDNNTIERVDFMEFIETASNAFLSYENKLALRNSLHAAVPSRSDTLEGSFLKMFAGLETLVLDFRRRENLEYVMPPPAWKEFRKHLQKSIRESTGPKLTSGQRDSIYRKLGELNRISLHEAFDELCKAYCIDLSDLWPVFESKTGIGLSEIRNRIVHGDPFPHDFISPLSIANEHLRYTIERVIIRIFGWNIDRTKVSRDYLLRNRLSIGKLPAAQAEIGELLGPQQKGVQM